MAADHLQGVESPNDHPKSILGASGAKLRLEYRKASELVENPKNWRRHPQSQIDTLGDVISQVGWAGACLLNEKTGRLIDGHARQKVALQNGDVPIPVLIGSWSEEEEALILATLDPIGGMAIGDQKAYQQLIDQINVQSESINDLIKNIEEQSGKEVERLIAEIGDQSAGQPSDTLGQSVGPAPEALPPDQAGPSLSESLARPTRMC
jgi:ParB-like chromosome segregation protein Spo0J